MRNVIKIPDSLDEESLEQQCDNSSPLAEYEERAIDQSELSTVKDG